MPKKVRVFPSLSDHSLKERLVYFAASAFLFGLFVIVSVFVHEDLFTSLDFDTTVRVQDNISRRIDSYFSSLSLLGSFELTGILFLAIVLSGFKKVYRWLLLGIFPLFHVVEIVGKTLIEHPGPPFMFHRYNIGFHFPSSYVNQDFFSYPSGHVGRTALLSGIGLFLILRSKKPVWMKTAIGGIIVVLYIAMVISRIYLGEHWFSDTLGGSLLGYSFALLTVAFW